MAALAEAFVRIRPDTSTFRQETEKGVTSAGPALKKIGDQHGKLFGTAFVRSTAGPLRGIAGVIGRPVAAAFAVIGGAKLFAGFIAEGREAQKVGAQTAAVIKSTGGAAKISSKQVGDLATAISNKVGVDDEAIQSGANLLLTFTGIRNEAGKGNRIFDQATTAVVDMTAAMNGGKVTQEGMKAASIQVGKALNDPIKGMTALRKVGVSFTDQQVEQVKAMVKSGNTLGARKLILRELNKEFGGSAAAGTNAMQKLGVVFGNIEEQVGTALLPVIDRVAAWLGARLPAAVAKASLGLRALTAAFREGDITSDGFVGVMERIGVSARRTFDYFKAEVLPRLRDFGGFLVGTVVPALADFGGWLIRSRNWLVPLAAGVGAIVVAMKIWTAVSKVFIAVQALVNAVLAANPIGIVVLALVGLVAAFVVAYKTSDTFRSIVQKAWAGIQVAVSFAWNSVIKPVFAALSAFVRNVLAPAVSWLWRSVVVPAFNGIRTVIQVVWPIIRGIFQTWVAFMRNVVGPAISWLWRNVVGPVFTGIKNTISTVWTHGIKPVLTVIGSFIRDKVAPGFSAGVTAIGRAWDRLKEAARGPVNFVIGTVLNRGIFAAYNWVVRKFGGTEIPNLPLIGSGGGGRSTTAGLARGGTVPFVTDGPRAIVGEGRRQYPEYVIPTDPAYRKRALSLYQDLGTKMYADGGVIGAGFRAGLARAASIVTANPDNDPTKWLTQKIAAALGAVGRSPFARMIMAVPRKIGSILIEKAKGLFTGGGAFAPGLKGVVDFARSQAGKPYIWGSAGPGGYDCSGFVSNLVEVAKGLPLYRRLFATGSMGSYPWTNHFRGAFRVGWVTGNPGHTGATVNGVNMESRGGDGVVVGAGSRGANQSIFNRHAYLARGGVIPGDPPFDLLDPRGKYFQPGLLEALRTAKTFDSGGWLHPGQVGINRSTRSERVRSGPQEDALLAELRSLRKAIQSKPLVRIPDDKYIRRTVAYGGTRDPGQWGP